MMKKVIAFFVAPHGAYGWAVYQRYSDHTEAFFETSTDHLDACETSRFYNAALSDGVVFEEGWNA
jgi:hypothetical protein